MSSVKLSIISMLTLQLIVLDENKQVEIEASSKVRDFRLKLVNDFERNVHLVIDYRGESLELRDDWIWSDLAHDQKLTVEVLMDVGDRCLSAIEEVLMGMEVVDASSIKVAELISAVKTGSLTKLIQVLGEQERDAAEELVSEDELFVNRLDDRGWTALHHACALNQSKLVQFLLSKGASCNKESKDGWIPLQLCAVSGYSESLSVLLKHDRIQVNKMTTHPSALHIACERNHMNVIIALLESGASMTTEDKRGVIPIEVCVSQEALELLPIYMGKQEVDKALHPENYSPPTAYSGEVYFTSNLVLDDRKVCLFLDVVHGLMSRYSSKAQWRAQNTPELTVPIVEIDDVRTAKSNMLGRDDLWYFLIESKQGCYCYFTKDKDRTATWVTRILRAIAYCQANKIGPLPTFRKLDITVVPGEAEPAPQPDSSPVSSPRGSISFEPEVNFSSFTITDEIGAGAFGNVFRVVKKDTGEVYAMKQLSKQMLIKNRQLKYAIGESKIMRHLNHPFIVTLYYAFETPRYLYLIMEFCPNGDLDGLISKKGRLEEQDAKLHLAEILLAIEYLHSHNIIYRDLKPANVLIDSEGHSRLADFGLAKENVSKTDPAKTFAGSPAYIAPELLNNNYTTRASDLYGLGVVLYEMLTGEPPFYCDDIEELFRRINKAKLNFPLYVSNEARDLITKLLNKNPDERPSFSQLKASPFFRNVNWDALMSRAQVSPPLSSQTTDSPQERDEEDMMFVLDQDYDVGTPRDRMIEGFSYMKDVH